MYVVKKEKGTIPKCPNKQRTAFDSDYTSGILRIRKHFIKLED